MMTDYCREYNRSDPPHSIQDQYGSLYRGRGGGGVQVFICLLTIPGNITGLITHTEYKINMVACTGGRGGGASIYLFTDYSRKYNRSDHPLRVQDRYGGLNRGEGRGGGVQVFICLLTIPGNITGLITHTEYKISMVACTGAGEGGGASIYLFTDYSRKYNRSDHPHRVQDQYGGLYRGRGGGGCKYLFVY